MWRCTAQRHTVFLTDRCQMHGGKNNALIHAARQLYVDILDESAGRRTLGGAQKS